MREKCLDLTVLGGTVVRIECDYKEFSPMTPYVKHLDSKKIGTGFLVRWFGLPGPILLTNHHVISNAVVVRGTTLGLSDGEKRKLKSSGTIHTWTSRSSRDRLK